MSTTPSIFITNRSYTYNDDLPNGGSGISVLPEIKPVPGAPFAKSRMKRPDEQLSGLPASPLQPQSMLQNLQKDVQAGGYLTSDGELLAHRFLSPNTNLSSPPYARAFSFAVNGVESNDSFIIQGFGNGDPQKNRIVLYMPDHGEGHAYHEFGSMDELRAWVARMGQDPTGRARFLSHFSEVAQPSVGNSLDMLNGASNSPEVSYQNDVVVGAYAEIRGDVSKRVGHAGSYPPGNGKLSDIQFAGNTKGIDTFRGKTAEGETVNYQYDAYGNLLGAGDRGHFFVQENGLRVPSASMEVFDNQSAFDKRVASMASDNVGANDLHGFMDELLNHLQNPAYGLGDALTQLGLNEGTSRFMEQFAGNPVGALLHQVNDLTGNAFGRALGMDQQHADELLDQAGLAIGALTPYGAEEFLARVIAKANKGEALSREEIADLNQWGSSTPTEKKEVVPHSGPAGISGASTPLSDVERYATSMTPSELATRAKKEGYGVYHLDGKQYVPYDGRVYQVRVNALQPDRATVIDPATQEETGEIFKRDVNNQWAPDKTPKLLGGAGGPAPANPIPASEPRRIVVPTDGVENFPARPRIASKDASSNQLVYHDVRYDPQVGAWKSNDGRFWWRQSSDREWVGGTEQEFKAAKDKLQSNYSSVINVPAIPEIPAQSELKEIPRDVHYVWIGGDLPEDRIANIKNNAAKASGYRHVVHVDVDDASFAKIKKSFEGYPAIEVKNLRDEPFFKKFQASEAYPAYKLFSTPGADVNYSAASDVLRYSLMDEYGGVYLDSDDYLKEGGIFGPLMVKPGDMLLSDQVSMPHGDLHQGFNSSAFATHPNNPLLKETTREMIKAFEENKSKFKNRPRAGSDGDEKFNRYMDDVFNITGPGLLNRVLKKYRPGIENLDLFKLRDLGIYENAVDLERDVQRIHSGIRYYVQLSSDENIFPVVIGSDHSWRHTR
ncbi:dermonecrotic toxin domain-containing protein [Dyella mobilis]|uniref:Dermonecrotic toxin N-terminal domain-containing protein n=1 Tax=Dyella mobilis TaxID=1849582 RepID=A0ABS2KBS6_9GAMM|nr:DUF6543 domain-containing protein [Dyella mobilis]MBM7128480.1 hypothetical protein [Dyella mobilis]